LNHGEIQRIENVHLAGDIHRQGCTGLQSFRPDRGRCQGQANYTEDDVRDKRITHRCSVEINEGDIVCITGPSGSGKSVLLRELENCIPADQRVSLRQIPTPSDKTVIDCIDGDMLSTLRIISIAGLNDTFSIAGLNDTFCVLNQPSNLSEGQKWRYRLAVALSSKKKYIFADEFCSNLDRLVSSIISYKVWQFARSSRTWGPTW